jgi:hypothetical protein
VTFSQTKIAAYDALYIETGSDCYVALKTQLILGLKTTTTFVFVYVYNNNMKSAFLQLLCSIWLSYRETLPNAMQICALKEGQTGNGKCKQARYANDGNKSRWEMRVIFGKEDVDCDSFSVLLRALLPT